MGEWARRDRPAGGGSAVSTELALACSLASRRVGAARFDMAPHDYGKYTVSGSRLSFAAQPPCRLRDSSAARLSKARSLPPTPFTHTHTHTYTPPPPPPPPPPPLTLSARYDSADTTLEELLELIRFTHQARCAAACRGARGRCLRMLCGARCAWACCAMLPHDERAACGRAWQGCCLVWTTHGLHVILVVATCSCAPASRCVGIPGCSGFPFTSIACAQHG